MRDACAIGAHAHPHNALHSTNIDASVPPIPLFTDMYDTNVIITINTDTDKVLKFFVFTQL